MSGRRSGERHLFVELSRLGLLLAGLCLLASMILLVGLSLFLLLEEPQGVAARILSQNSSHGEYLVPQPQTISPAETNMVVVTQKAGGLFGGTASLAATWANGKRFDSGAAAAWEILAGAWRLWLLGIVVLAAYKILHRFTTSPLPPHNSKGIP